ncbi:CBS domain-containing protein [Paraflavitalea soli]|uniref:CBS domain-containing protein n=1 Tax=Paraflavitalea soli TaxID=2315862 RepID=A0A3B7MPT5_9BACT|nr:CBS domain-containing protein [Paraflavitalea soli]AXY76512.1 CBS domain-containing protein [Paraflavitalea soli]
MLNKELISATIPTLNLKDSVFQALELMSEFHVMQLAVVADDKYLGFVSEDDLMNVDENLTLQSLEAHFSKAAVRANTHFMEAVQVVNDHNLSIIPVVEPENVFAGVITAADLLKQLGKTTGANEPGGIIVLEMEQRSFSFSEISKLVETNDAQITQLNTNWDTSTGSFIVTLKINKFEISDIIATFQRYEYQIKYYFGEELYENELRSNYDHLMNYLSI